MKNSSNTLKLTVGGMEYRGWTSASVTRSIEAISGRFTLGLTESWPGQSTVWPILPGDSCEVSIGGDTVITGMVDSAAPQFSAESHDITASGRDQTGQMVDCSAVHSPGEWAGLKLDRIAGILATPFGISVTSQVDVGAAWTHDRGFKLQPSESAFEALDRACRMRGILPISDGRGGLVLTKPGQTRCTTALVQGQNVKSASLANDITERFRTYIVRGSQPGSDDMSPDQSSAVEARATDAGAAAGRTLIIIAEGSVDIASARKRAQWESTVRAARAVSVSVTVQGWRQGDGTLWPVNGLVQVDLPWLRISGEMLITELTYSLDESGTQTQMTLRRKDAYTPEPEKPVEEDPWGNI
jgi:prophage tail gpP-like protein